MKYLRSLCLLLLSFISTSLLANSITAYNNQTAYVTKNFVFHNEALAQGFVRLNEGFTVAPHSCVNMDVLFTISGGIDLRETSTIRMLKDLKFDSGVTLTTGGNIDGRGHTLILNGDFRIPAGKVLHFNGDTILDARGNEIIIGENAEIFVDTNVTLTILNATIKTTRNAPTFPALRCGAFNSKLALDNVVLEPADDFLFLGGRFFIHNDVAVTGTSAFVYNSPVPSFITKDSCLYLDHAVTFSMAPATFTDAPYSLKNTYTDNNFIKMADETSVLYLDGNTLQTTNTGWRVTTGTVSIDNRLQIKTDPTLTMTALEPIVVLQNSDWVEADAVAWHPSGNYLAVGNGLGAINVYSFDGSILTFVAQAGAPAYAMNWSPDGRYLAVGVPADYGPTPGSIFIFDGTSLTFVANTGEIPCWSPDGRYIASTSGGTTLQIHRFDGLALEYITQLGVNDLYFLSWSPDGRHLVGGGATGLADRINVYDFDGTSLQLVTNYTNNVHYAQATDPWSPDGRYVACTRGINDLSIFRFDGNSLILSDSFPDQGLGQTVWSSDGKYVAICADTSIPKVMVFSFDGKSLHLIPGSLMALTDATSYQEWIRFSPNGKYLAVCYSNFNSPAYGVLKIFAADYVQATTPQSLTNGMVFGDSAKGSAYDAHLRLQPGASINLEGKMFYDNVDGVQAMS